MASWTESNQSETGFLFILPSFTGFLPSFTGLAWFRLRSSSFCHWKWSWKILQSTETGLIEYFLMTSPSWCHSIFFSADVEVFTTTFNSWTEFFCLFFLVWEWTSFFFIIEFPFIAVHWILEVQSFVLFFYCFWFYRARYQFYWVFTELLINELGFFSRHYSDLWTNLIGFHGWLQILLGFTGFYLVSNRSGQAHPRFSWLRFIHLCGRLTKWWSGCKFWFYRVFLPSLPSFTVFSQLHWVLPSFT